MKPKTLMAYGLGLMAGGLLFHTYTPWFCIGLVVLGWGMILHLRSRKTK